MSLSVMFDDDFLIYGKMWSIISEFYSSFESFLRLDSSSFFTDSTCFLASIDSSFLTFSGFSLASSFLGDAFTIFGSSSLATTKGG